MSKVLAVAKWEYIEKVKTKAFLIGLVLTPIIFVATGVLPSLFASEEDKETKVIGVIDRSGAVADEFARRMESEYRLANGQPNYLVRRLAEGTNIDVAQAMADADKLVADNEIEGYCVVSGVGRVDSLVEYRSKIVGDFRIGMRIEETLRTIIAERRALAMGLDLSLLKDLNVQIAVKSVKLSKTGEKEEAGFERVFISAYVFLMMLFLLIVTSGQMLVRSVIEEKSNRIVEVLASSCSSTELMAGKVLGLSALGFTQMGFWTLIGVVASLQFGITLVDPGQAALLIVYFALGYLFYASVFIAAGSPLTTEQEAQQVTSYLVLFLLIPIIVALPAMKNPDAGWLKVLTYIPLLTPTMMALRIPIQMPSTPEIIATITLMVLSIYFGMVTAGRIFRIGILSTGKTPRLAEILHWARTG